MNNLVLNILLAVVWCTLNGDFGITNLIVGLMLGFIVVSLSQRALEQNPHYFTNTSRTSSEERPNYFTKLLTVVRFIFWFLWELIIANFRVAYEVVTPSFQMQPGVVGIPLDIKTDAEITMLANLITLTPGTLSLDVSEDRRILYIHTMYIEQGDVEAFKRDIKENFEKRVMEVYA